MRTVRAKIDLSRPHDLPAGRVDHQRLDATTDADIAAQQKSDDQESVRDAAKFARRVRRRLGLTQSEFSLRLNIPLETIRNWEQGKRTPTGTARTLLRLLDRAPELAILALN